MSENILGAAPGPGPIGSATLYIKNNSGSTTIATIDGTLYFPYALSYLDESGGYQKGIYKTSESPYGIVPAGDSLYDLSQYAGLSTIANATVPDVQNGASWINGTVTLYVVEGTPTGYTLSYATEHGTAPQSVSNVTTLTSEMLPTLSATGWRFDGWYYESTFTTQAQVGDTLSADTTLYAKWSVKTYTYYYRKNDGTTDYVTQTKTHGVPVTLLGADTFTREGYTLKEWNEEADGSGLAWQFGAECRADGRLNLYAIWEQNASTLDVTYNSTKIIDSLEVTPPVAVTYNGSTIATLNAGDTKTLDILGSDNKPKILSTPIVIGGKTIPDVDALGRKWVFEHNLVVEVGGVTPTGETWVINEVPVIATRKPPLGKRYINFSVSFTSNGDTFDRFFSNTYVSGDVLVYLNGVSETFAFNAEKFETAPFWYDQAYRTITLDEPAAGDFLTWLQANAVKQ